MSNRRPLAVWIAAAAVWSAFNGACSSNDSANGNVGGAGGIAGQLVQISGSSGMLVQPSAGGSSTPTNAMGGTTSLGTSTGPGAGIAGMAGAGMAVTGTGGSFGGMTTGVGGAAGMAPSSAGGTPAAMPTGTSTPPPVTSCPAAPADAPSNAVQALNTLNQIRLAAGAGCMNLVSALDTSATAHCNYEAANASNTMCTSDPHGEVMSCTGYTGATAQAREIAAGYSQLLAYTEVLTTYGNNPVAAVPSWIDTVWHRIPLLDPWTVDMGYGGAARCDVIDIGRGMSTVPADTIVVYPYDGQTNVPPSFSGLEGPAPPPPAGGFPSSYPINIYAERLSVTDHVLTKDGDSTPIDHLWLDMQSSQVSAGLKGYFTDTAFLYGAPFAANTKYHVKIAGTYAGGTLMKEWSFTTGAARPF
ncbi:MAG TPA: hypothetical protein VHC69_21585 [Polyangiaceae bacterium]|nr:hypothetical protein [Polyangiaceae bacterium]